jgi:hypothetical protein
MGHRPAWLFVYSVALFHGLSLLQVDNLINSFYEINRILCYAFR